MVTELEPMGITQRLRAYLLNKYAPEFCAREGIEAMSGTELIQWMNVHAPDKLQDAVLRSFGIPRLEDTARRLGVDPDECRAHVEAGDVEQWLAAQGKAIPRGEEFTSEQLERRKEAAKAFDFEFVPDLTDGVEYTIQSFVNFQDRAGTRTAKQAVMEWADGASLPFLTLSASTGTGKSHLLHAAAWALKQRGAGVIFREDRKLYEDWRKSFGGDVDASRTFRDADYLIIDDLGRDAETSWTRATLDELIDHRYQRRMPTLIATNLAADELPGRLASRLGDVEVGRIILMRASDIRQERRA